MNYTHRRYKVTEMPFNIVVFAYVMSFFIVKISHESSYNVSSEQYISHFALLPSSILKGNSFFRVFTAPFITYSYWEIFTYIFFIFLIAKNVEYLVGTFKILRIFLESYFLFIVFSCLFFKNAYIYGLWFYIFNALWFYLRSQSDNRWFKYGYPIFCVVFSLLVLHNDKKEYWKLGHLCGMLCVYFDEKISTIVSSIINSYKAHKVQARKNYVENIEKQIDNILEKIYEFGYDSLTKIEKDILFKASKIYREKLNKRD